jgi:hypothetical protein
MNAAEARQRATEQGKRNAEAQVKTLEHRFKQCESDQKVVSNPTVLKPYVDATLNRRLVE